MRSRSARGACPGSCPSTVASPPSRAGSPRGSRRSSSCPRRSGPSRPNTSPSATSKLTPRSASTRAVGLSEIGDDDGGRHGRRRYALVAPGRVARVPSLRYVVFDVFTDTALSGNQLAVFTDARGLDARARCRRSRWRSASRRRRSCYPPRQADTARVRIFNPGHEMPFAGHPILGTAWVLAQPLQRGVIELETGMRDRSGRDRPRRVGRARLRADAAAGARRSASHRRS